MSALLEILDFVTVFKPRLKTVLFSQAFSLSFSTYVLINTLPGPSTSEVTTGWCHTNLFIIIIINISDHIVCDL